MIDSLQAAFEHAAAALRRVDELNVYEDVPDMPADPYAILTHLGGSTSADSYDLKVYLYVRADRPGAQQYHRELVDVVEGTLADVAATTSRHQVEAATDTTPAWFVSEFEVTVFRQAWGSRL